MGHQAIESQEKAFEIAMKLEGAPRDDTELGVQQIQGYLEEMHMEIQNLQKERGTEASPERWCIRCRANGHTKDNCLLIADYMKAREPSPLHPREVAAPRGSMLWCDDFCVVWLHDTNHCPRIVAYVPEVKQ